MIPLFILIILIPRVLITIWKMTTVRTFTHHAATTATAQGLSTINMHKSQAKKTLINTPYIKHSSDDTVGCNAHFVIRKSKNKTIIHILQCEIHLDAQSVCNSFQMLNLGKMTAATNPGRKVGFST